MSTPVVTILCSTHERLPLHGGRVFQALPLQQASALERKWQAVSQIRQSPLVERSGGSEAKSRGAIQAPKRAQAVRPRAQDSPAGNRVVYRF